MTRVTILPHHVNELAHERQITGIVRHCGTHCSDAVAGSASGDFCQCRPPQGARLPEVDHLDPVNRLKSRGSGTPYGNQYQCKPDSDHREGKEGQPEPPIIKQDQHKLLDPGEMVELCGQFLFRRQFFSHKLTHGSAVVVASAQRVGQSMPQLIP